MTLEDFLQRVVWLGDQPSPDWGGGGKTFGAGDAADTTEADIDYVANLTTAQGEWDPWLTQD